MTQNRASEVLFLVVICASSLFPQNPVSLSADTNHSLLLENDYARVFSLVIPPRSHTQFHLHSSDYVRITITDGNLRFTMPGTADVLQGFEKGFTQFISAGVRHVVSNEDAFATYCAVVVEVKKHGIRPGYAYDYATARAMIYDSIPPPVDPHANFTTSHLTPTVDGFDMQIVARNSMRVPECPQGCLLVAVSNLTLESQETSRNSVIGLEAGDAVWLAPSDETRLLKNSTFDSARFVLLRFK